MDGNFDGSMTFHSYYDGDGWPVKLRMNPQASGSIILGESGGNVGIGTTNPVEKLQLGNGIAFHNGGDKILAFGYSPSTGNTLMAGNPAEVRWSPASGLLFATDGTTRATGATAGLSYRMTIANNGKVGIGVGPLTSFHVGDLWSETYNATFQALNWWGIAMPDAGYAGSADGRNHYMIGRGAGHADRRLTVHVPSYATYGSTGTHPSFTINSTGAVDLVKVLADTGDTYIKGNVGIGTTSPGSLLELYGGTSKDQLRIGHGGLYYQIGRDTSNGFLSLKGTQNDNSGFSFKVASGGSEQERMTILNSGNVGVGTTAPQNKIHVHEASGGFANIQFTNTDTGSATASDGMRVGVGSDENGYIYHGGAYGLKFGTSNTERVRIDSAGNVGIGTTSPSAKLTVSGNIYQTWLDSNKNYVNYYDSSYYQGMEGDATNRILSIVNRNMDGAPTGAQGSIQFKTGTVPATAMTVAVNGNVGIGTTNPRSKLNVAGNGANTGGNGLIVGTVGEAISTAVALNAEVGRFEIGFPGWRDMEQNQIGAKIAGIRKNYYQNNNALVQATELAFFTGDGNNEGGTSNLIDTSSERMRIDQNGNVGIGTTGPVSKLHLKQGTGGHVAADGVVIQKGDTTQSWSNWMDGANNLNWAFGATSALPSTSQVSISSTGNVGIGTTAPSGKLQVVGGIWAGSAANSYITDDGTRAMFTTPGQTIPLFVGIDQNTALGINIATSGYVGVGTTNPTTLLYVNGTATFKDSGSSGNHLVTYNNGAAYYIQADAAGTSKNLISALSTDYTYFNANNVGIGTTAPNRPLHIYGTGGTAALNSSSGEIAYFDNNVSQGLAIGASSATPYSMWLQTKRGTNDGSSWPLALNPMGGNVGIGTTAPSQQLAVASTNPKIQLDETDSGSNGYTLAVDSNVFSIGRYSAQTFNIFGSNVGISTTCPKDTFLLSYALASFSNVKRS